MKWKHWLVWGLLAVWSIWLGFHADAVERENAALQDRLEKSQESNRMANRLSRYGYVAEIDLEEETAVRVIAAKARWDTDAPRIKFCLFAENKKAVAWCGYAARRRYRAQ